MAMAQGLILLVLGVSSLMMGASALKNVLFIMVDDLRPELGIYYDMDMETKGKSIIHPSIYTPNMNALARDSILFENAYSQYAVCCPSRSSLLTGRRPDTTQVFDKQTFWRDVAAGGNYTTIPQYFKENGYITAGMGKIFHPGPTTGNDDVPVSWSTDYMDYYHSVNLGFYGQSDLSWAAVTPEEEASKPLPDQDLATEAITVLTDLAAQTKPFFLAVGFQKPHLPFTFPESYLTQYSGDDVSVATNNFPPTDCPELAWSKYAELRGYNDIADLEATDGVTGEMGTNMPDSKAIELRRAYYASVTYVDALIGSVVDQLTTLGIADNTIVSLIGDHGWQLGDHSEWAKSSNFEEAVRVPMMIKIPGDTDGGMNCSNLVELVDLFPTLVDASGLTAIPQCESSNSAVLTCHEGSSLIPLVTAGGNSNSWKTAVFSQMKNAPSRMSYSIRTDQYRYNAIMVWTSATGTDWSKIRAKELYDYDTDIMGNVNVASTSSYNTIRDALHARIEAGWLAELNI